MKKVVLLMFAGCAAILADGQLLRSRSLGTAGGENLLVEPMPFETALRKAKQGDAAAFYALAVHYAKGDEITADSDLASHFLKKAVEGGDPNATLVGAMLSDRKMARGNWRMSVSYYPSVGEYTGVSNADCFGWEASEWSPTNDVEVASVRAGYERAVKLGVGIASYELAKFDRKIASIRKELKAAADAEAARQEKLRRNALLAEEMFGTEIKAERSAREAARKSIERREREEQRAAYRRSSEEQDRVRSEKEKIKKEKIDAGIEAFVKEHFGVKLGDPISAFPDDGEGKETSRYWSWCCRNPRKIGVLKKYQYFDNAIGGFLDGRLVRICFFAKFDKKYSTNSIEARVKPLLSEMYRGLGILNDCDQKVFSGSGGASYRINYISDDNQHKIRGVLFCAQELENAIRQAQEDREAAAGDELPPPQ